MSRPQSLWKTAIDRGVQALDWSLVRDTIGEYVACRVGRALSDEPGRLAAHAAREADKHVAAYEPVDGPDLAAAAKAREVMARTVRDDALDYDRILQLKAAYRLALAETLWRMVKDDAPHKLQRLAIPDDDFE